MSHQVLPRPVLRVEIPTHAVASVPKAAPSPLDPSRMIRDLSGLMALGVLLMHSTMGGLSPQSDATVVRLVQTIVQSHGFAVRVPLFFAFSGWLFWRSAPTGLDYARKIRSRTRTVLGPYLLWGGLAVGGGLMAEALVGRALPTPLDAVKTWLLFGNYPLWYLRHLFEIFLLSPALGWALRERHRGVAVLAGLWAWVMFGPIRYAGGSLPTASDVFFVSVGGYAAIHGLAVPRLRRSVVRLAAPAYFAAVIAASLVTTPEANVGHRVFDLLAVGGGLLLLGTYRPEWAIFRLPLVRAAQRYGVFVYLAQEPMLTWIRTGLLRVAGTSVPALLAEFFLAPLLTALALTTVAKALEERVPKLYAFLTGGRRPRPEVTQASRPNLIVVQGGLADAPRERERIAA